MYLNNNSNDCISIEPGRRIPDLQEDVRLGLLSQPRSLPPKYFYDARGSELFDQICDTNEYYPTRTEDALLNRHSGEIIQQTKPDEIIELGSGTSQKTRHLFDACEDHAHVCRYAPFDVCQSMLEESAAMIRSEYDWLNVHPLLGDYNGGLENLPVSQGSRLYVFLGGTIGNFDRRQAKDFISEIQSRMRTGDHLLLGVDRIKDTDILHAAYNDKQGITAEFNLNVLRVINRELRANFDPDFFRHKAIFNSNHNQIEMYLVSNCDQTVSIEQLNTSITLMKDEKILTEVSCKYDEEEFTAILRECDLEIINHFEPENNYFSLFLARV